MPFIMGKQLKLQIKVPEIFFQFNKLIHLAKLKEICCICKVAILSTL